MKIGVVGCGMISDIYLENMIHRFDNLEVVACASRTEKSTYSKAEKYKIRPMTVDALMEDPEIEMVVNLTPVPAHYDIVKKALEHGKHVYSEKTLTLLSSQARELIDLAHEKGLYLGCAPETILGPACQKAKEIIESGQIGQVTGFHIMLNLNLSIMYPMFNILTLPGGGIGMDRGVYFLNELIYLLGNVSDFGGYSVIHDPDRDIPVQGEPGAVRHITLENENQMVASIRLENGILGTMNLNGNTIFPELSHIEIYGTKGIMIVPDANTFGGQVKVFKNTVSDMESAWTVYECDNTNLRGIGPSVMAEAIESGAPDPMDAERDYQIIRICEALS